MTHHQPEPTPADGPYEVVISDETMRQLADAPPEVTDQLAAVIARAREYGPDNVGELRPLNPHPVDHSPGRPQVYVPAVRSVSYLRGAVADISPLTVEDFDRELRQDTTADTPDAQINGLRAFLVRWTEYVALQGDHDRMRRIEAAQDSEEFGTLLSEALADAHRRYFPDAHGGDFSVRIAQEGDRYTAVCPVTLLRRTRATPEDATQALRAALLGLLTGQ